MFVYLRVSSSPLLPWRIECINRPVTTTRQAGYISRSTFRNVVFQHVWQGEWDDLSGTLPKNTSVYAHQLIAQEIGQFLSWPVFWQIYLKLEHVSKYQHMLVFFLQPFVQQLSKFQTYSYIGIILRSALRICSPRLHACSTTVANKISNLWYKHLSIWCPWLTLLWCRGCRRLQWRYQMMPFEIRRPKASTLGL